MESSSTDGPPPPSKVIYVWWSDDGKFIRQWQTWPFKDGLPYALSDMAPKDRRTGTASKSLWDRRERRAPSAPCVELPFIVEYRRKPEEAFSYWKEMAAFDHEGPAEAYAKQCYSETGPWEYRVRPHDERNGE